MGAQWRSRPGARLPARWALVTGLGCGLACGPSGGLGDGSGTGEAGTTRGDATVSPTASGPTGSTTATPTSGTRTTSAPDTGAQTTAGGLTDGGGSDTGAPATCMGASELRCALAIDCEAFSCGSAESWFDSDGCLRRACGPGGSCPAGDACFVPAQWGCCASSAVVCQEQDGVCECASKPDCGGQLCVPQAQVPPTLCTTIDDPGLCADAGCSPVPMVRPIVAAGEACLCDLPQSRCLWVPPRTQVDAGPATAYLELASGDVLVFAQQYTPPPLGYVACADLDPAPAEYDCADVLPCAM